eukprot:gene17265-18989_t
MSDFENWQYDDVNGCVNSIGTKPLAARAPRTPKIRPDLYSDTVVYNPHRYHQPMQISELLKKFKVHDGAGCNSDAAGGGGGTGRLSELSVPSSSSRRSVVISPVVSASGRASRVGSTRIRFPFEVSTDHSRPHSKAAERKSQPARVAAILEA